MAQLAYTAIAIAAVDPTFQAKTAVAIAFAAQAILSSTQITDPRYLLALQIVNPSTDVIHRTTNRILVLGTVTTASLDSDIQAAVNGLIPATGPFSL